MTTKHALSPLGSFAQAAYGHGIAPINSAGLRSGEFIAVVHFADKSRGQSTDGQKTYARLFAAAPELLAAAEAFMDGEGNCKEVRAMFRAAIAKAKGEQQ